MSFTYDPENLEEPLNHLRFLVQDTEEKGHFLEDSEITHANSLESNIYRTAAGLCRVLAAKFAQMPGQEDGLILKSEDKAKAYLAMARNYDEKADQIEQAFESGSSEGLNLPTVNSSGPAFTRDLHFS